MECYKNTALTQSGTVVHYISMESTIGGVMASVLALSMVNRGIESRSGQTKDYKLDMCYFSARHTALRRTSKDWLA